MKCLVLLGFLSVGCGTDKPVDVDTSTLRALVYKTPTGGIDSDLRAYYEDFKAAATANGKPLKGPTLKALHWVDKVSAPDAGEGEGYYGGCIIVKQFDGTRYAEVQIENSARSLPLPVLKLLVTHELGHCLSDLKHSDHEGSIMYPSIGSKEQIEHPEAYEDDAWKSLVGEMFK